MFTFLRTTKQTQINHQQQQQQHHKLQLIKWITGFSVYTHRSRAPPLNFNNNICNNAICIPLILELYVTNRSFYYIYLYISISHCFSCPRGPSGRSSRAHVAFGVGAEKCATALLTMIHVFCEVMNELEIEPGILCECAAAACEFNPVFQRIALHAVDERRQ